MNDYAKLYQQLVLWSCSVRDLYLRYVSPDFMHQNALARLIHHTLGSAHS